MRNTVQCVNAFLSISVRERGKKRAAMFKTMHAGEISALTKIDCLKLEYCPTSEAFSAKTMSRDAFYRLHFQNPITQPHLPQTLIFMSSHHHL